MATLHVEHPITDLDTWLRAFGRFEEGRTKAGVRRIRSTSRSMTTSTSTSDEFDHVEQASAFKGFLETNVWASQDASPRLAGTPRARVLMPVSTGSKATEAITGGPKARRTAFVAVDLRIGIEKEDHRAPLQRGQLDVLAVLILDREVGGEGAGLEHAPHATPRR